MQVIFKKNIDQVVEGCKAGDRAAQRKLYDFFSGKMLAVCMRYARDQSEAEDILQDGFIRVFRKIDTFKGHGSFEGWLRRVVVNTAIRHCQNRQKMYKVIYLDDLSTDVGEDLLEVDFEYNDLLKMVHNLPDGYRMVFNLYAIEGYSHKEIADQLNISEGTSKSQLARARQHLKVLITKHRESVNNYKSGQSAG